MVFLLFSLTCCFDGMDNKGTKVDAAKTAKVQNTNIYQTVIKLTGKRNHSRKLYNGERRFKETNSLTYRPGPKYTQP